MPPPLPPPIMIITFSIVYLKIKIQKISSKYFISISKKIILKLTQLKLHMSQL